MRLPLPLLAALLAACLLPARAADSAAAQLADDRFAAGGSVRQAQPVEGDFIAAGGDIDLAATVQGDAVLGGGDVRVRERVAHDLYAGGGNVRIEAPIGRNARIGGGNVEITAQGAIGGNLSIAGGSVEVRGPVGGHARLAGGDVLIDSTIEGDVTVAAGELTLGPNARIGGRLVHRGTTKLQRDPAAQVAGGVERAAPMRTELRGTERRRDRGGWFWTLGLIALAGFIAAAFPVGSRRLGENLRGEPGLALVFGFIALVCVPVAAVMLVVTIIGIPLAVAVLLLYFVVLIVGYAAVAVVIGDAALARLRSQDAARAGWRAGAAMLAMLALALLGRIPFVGALVVLAALLAGVGAMVLLLPRRENTPPATAAG